MNHRIPFQHFSNDSGVDDEINGDVENLEEFYFRPQVIFDPFVHEFWAFWDTARIGQLYSPEVTLLHDGKERFQHKVQIHLKISAVGSKWALCQQSNRFWMSSGSSTRSLWISCGADLFLGN